MAWTRSIVWILVLLLAAPSDIFAAQPKRPWSRLARVKAGSRINVSVGSCELHEGLRLVRVTDVELQVTRSEGGPPTTFERSNVIGVWQYLGRARSRRFLSLAILVGGLAAAFTLISGRGGRTLAVMGVAFAYYGVGSDADRRPRFEPVYLGPDFASCVYSTRRR